MYKVTYSKIAIMNDGSHGNISQGDDTAYLSCLIEDIPAKLENDLKPKRRYPIIKTIVKVVGHIVI